MESIALSPLEPPPIAPWDRLPSSTETWPLEPVSRPESPTRQQGSSTNTSSPLLLSRQPSPAPEELATPPVPSEELVPWYRTGLRDSMKPISTEEWPLFRNERAPSPTRFWGPEDPTRSAEAMKQRRRCRGRNWSSPYPIYVRRGRRPDGNVAEDGQPLLPRESGFQPDSPDSGFDPHTWPNPPLPRRQRQAPAQDRPLPPHLSLPPPIHTSGPLPPTQPKEHRLPELVAVTFEILPQQSLNVMVDLEASRRRALPPPKPGVVKRMWQRRKGLWGRRRAWMSYWQNKWKMSFFMAFFGFLFLLVGFLLIAHLLVRPPPSAYEHSEH